MSKKKLLVGVLAGTMLVASIGVHASSISKDVYKLDKLSTTSISQEVLPLKTSSHVQNGENSSMVIKLDDVLELSDLSQELQDQLIERHGDMAYEMLFLNMEEAEQVAKGEAEASIMKPAAIAVPMTSITKTDTIAVPVTSIMKSATTAAMVTSIASEGDAVEAENTVSFSELTEEVQEKLTKVYGDFATEMVFPSVEYAEKLADRDPSKVTTSEAIPATPMTPASTK